MALQQAGHRIDVHGQLQVADALRLSAVQAIGALFAVALVLTWVGSWRRVGLRAPAGSAVAGWSALLPVGLLVIAPTIGYVLATGKPLVHPSIDPAEAMAYVLLAVLVSINEELWFRGLVVDVLGGRLRPWLVIAGSALLFGLPHYGGSAASLLNMAGVTLAVGIPFAVVRLRHHSLVPLIAWHAVIDAWAFLHTARVVATGDPSTTEMAVGLVLPAVLGVGYLVWFAKEPGPEPDAVREPD